MANSSLIDPLNHLDQKDKTTERKKLDKGKEDKESSQTSSNSPQVTYSTKLKNKEDLTKIKNQDHLVLRTIDICDKYD